MAPTRSISLTCLVFGFMFGLSSCAQRETLPTAGTTSMEQRLSDLERRMERVESKPEIAQPYRSKEELEASIVEFEAERRKLLISYTPQHPAIRDIDRKLVILNSQLKMLK